MLSQTGTSKCVKQICLLEPATLPKIIVYASNFKVFC